MIHTDEYFIDNKVKIVENYPKILAMRVIGDKKHPLSNKFIEFISKKKRERLGKFRFAKDFNRGLFADIIIRYAIIEQLGVNNSQIIFEENKYGKPFLKGFPKFHFNVSHSGEWVVCAISNFSIGIDIERIKNIDLKIADSFFSKQESEYLISLPQNKRIDYFFTLWSLKESYIKALGKGLSIALDSFSVKKEDETITLKRHDNELEPMHFRCFDIDPNYKLAVCGSSEKNLPTSIKHMHEETLLKFMTHHS